MKIAIVYDRANKFGGAERLVECVRKIFPQAHLYTSVYNAKTATWATKFDVVRTTFLNHIPFANKNHELLPFLMPIAFESLNFAEYNLVISITSAEAKGIITSPKTLHLCYCLTPTRYLYSQKQLYFDTLPRILKPISKILIWYLKGWDSIAKSRPDLYISISNTVKSRLKEYYNIESGVIYPPMCINTNHQPISKKEDFYLWVGRLVEYKKIKEIVNVFNKNKKKLVVVGTGKLYKSLKDIAGSNIALMGFVDEKKLVELYSKAKAVIFTHDEDFGLVPIEAMSMGTPVIGLNTGGVSETVIDGKTGYLISSISKIDSAIELIDKKPLNRDIIIERSKFFSQKKFNKLFSNYVKRVLLQHNKKGN